MKVGDLLQETQFPEFGLERWRALAEKALGGAAFEDALVSRTDDGIRIDPLAPRAAMPRRAPRAAIRCAVDRRAAHRRSRSARAPTGRRSTISSRARPASRWSSRARRTPSATACRPSRKRSAIALHDVPLNHVHLRLDAHPASRAMRRLAGRAARQAPRRSGQAQPLLRHRSGGDLCRHRPAAHVDRGAAGVDAAIAGAFLRARACPASCSKATAASSTMPARPKRRSSASCSRPPSAHLRHVRGGAPGAGLCRAAYRLRAQRSTRTSSCRSPRSGRCGCCGRACRRPARSRRRAASIHAETSYRMMTAMDPETNILRTTIAAFAAAAGGADTDLDPAAHASRTACPTRSPAASRATRS